MRTKRRQRLQVQSDILCIFRVGGEVQKALETALMNNLLPHHGHERVELACSKRLGVVVGKEEDQVQDVLDKVLRQLPHQGILDDNDDNVDNVSHLSKVQDMKISNVQFATTSHGMVKKMGKRSHRVSSKCKGKARCKLSYLPPGSRVIPWDCSLPRANRSSAGKKKRNPAVTSTPSPERAPRPAPRSK